jgi:hypothetical protein
LSKPMFEESDVIIDNRGRWATVLFVFVVVGLCLGVGLFVLHRGSLFGPRLELSSSSSVQTILPMDNATSVTDLASLRNREDKILSTYGASVMHPGFQRIPILEAMKRLAALGMPPRPGAPAPLPAALPPNVPNNGRP